MSFKLNSLLTILLLCLPACRGQDSANPAEIKIGAIVSLTGPANEQGQSWLNGALLAVDELKLQGIPVRVIIEDDATQPGKVATAFQKLAVIDRVSGILGGTWDFLAQAAFSLAKQHSVPFITMTNPVELFDADARRNPWVFTNALSIGAMERATREFLKSLQVKKIAVAYPSIAWGYQYNEMFKRLEAELHIERVLNIEFPADASYLDSLRLAALKVTQAEIDLAFMVSDYAGLDIITAEFVRLKTSPVVLTTQHLEDAFRLSRQPDRYRNLFGIYPRISDADFTERYQQKFKEPPRVYAAEGYDALNFLAQALAKGVKLNEPDATFSTPGITGVQRVPTPDRALAQNDAIIMTTQKGRFEIYRP